MKCNLCLDKMLKTIRKEFKDTVPEQELQRRIAALPEAITTAMRPVCLDCYLLGRFITKFPREKQ